MLRAETIRSQHSDIFTFLQGDLDATATVCHRPEDTCRESLVYLSDSKQLESNACLDAAILIVHRKLLADIDVNRDWRGCLFSVAAIPPALANAMLAGVLFSLCLAPVKAMAEGSRETIALRERPALYAEA